LAKGSFSTLLRPLFPETTEVIAEAKNIQIEPRLLSDHFTVEGENLDSHAID
jgi:hypothetical protein